jgi:hypothetical protein
MYDFNSSILKALDSDKETLSVDCWNEDFDSEALNSLCEEISIQNGLDSIKWESVGADNTGKKIIVFDLPTD